MYMTHPQTFVTFHPHHTQHHTGVSRGAQFGERFGIQRSTTVVCVGRRVRYVLTFIQMLHVSQVGVRGSVERMEKTEDGEVR